MTVHILYNNSGAPLCDSPVTTENPENQETCEACFTAYRSRNAYILDMCEEEEA